MSKAVPMDSIVHSCVHKPVSRVMYCLSIRYLPEYNDTKA